MNTNFPLIHSSTHPLILVRAIQIAAAVHAGQRDDARLVAVLHGVVEDCSHKGGTFERLRQKGMSQRPLDALASVTKRPDEEANRMKFVMRAGQHEIGSVVKIADPKDNLDMARISNPTERVKERCERYRQTLKRLDDHSRR